MTRLVRDRYYAVDAAHVWDLATGYAIARAAIDVAGATTAVSTALSPLIEVLDHGREGEPRWIALDDRDTLADAAVANAAEAACLRGYVPIAADLYPRIAPLLGEDLANRALLLIATDRTAPAIARTALLAAAAQSPRPHVLLSIRAAETRSTATPRRRDLWLVREARSTYAAQSVRRSPEDLPSDVQRHLERAGRAREFVLAGRHAAAERLLRDVAAALDRRKCHGPAAQTLISLGRLLLERGRAGDADGTFAAAAASADAGGDEARACEARVWQAAARTDAGRLTAAEALARAVLLAGPDDVRAQGRATLARVLLWQGRVEEASDLDLQLPDPAADAFPFVVATATRVLLARGEIFDAGRIARRLLTERGDPAADGVGALLAHTAHLRVLLAMGDLHLGERCLETLAAAARTTRAPLRLVRARLLWTDALARAGRTREAAAVLECLRRVRGVVPPLLRDTIDSRTATHLVGNRPPARPRAPAVPSAAAALVTLAQGEEHDGDAIRRILEMTAHALQASRVELWSADAGPPTAVITVGAGIATRLGSRVLDAGIVIGPEPGDQAHEIGVPVRLGSRLLAAIATRWPVDRTPPAIAHDLLAVAAAASAPRVEVMLARAREVARASTLVPELVGTSAAIGDVRKAIARSAGAPFAVLIEGESGVGKELVARAIHQLSPRRERRFCDVNCAALPDELLESELFGHARGAFTGAVADRAGLVEEADGGTLFLDEVADLSPRAQAKLLRVIQQQDVRRVGETFSRPVDVRVVSAANRDMRIEAAERRFRQDLLYRLDVIRVWVPPLRERPEDVPLLAQHFWRAAAARVGTRAELTHAVVSALARYHWPGNVRELQNVMAALAVAAPARGQVRPSLLPGAVTSAAPVTSGRLAEARARFERRFVEVALARAGGSRTQAARELGVSRQGLLKIIERHGLR